MRDSPLVRDLGALQAFSALTSGWHKGALAEAAVSDLQALLTGATGLEPAASGVTGRRSNQLSYAPEGWRAPKDCVEARPVIITGQPPSSWRRRCRPSEQGPAAPALARARLGCPP